jgi:hypothetical protein
VSFTESVVLRPLRDGVERERERDDALERELVLFALLLPLREAAARARVVFARLAEPPDFARLLVDEADFEFVELERFFWAGFFVCAWAMLTLLSSDSVPHLPYPPQRAVIGLREIVQIGLSGRPRIRLLVGVVTKHAIDDDGRGDTCGRGDCSGARRCRSVASDAIENCVQAHLSHGLLLPGAMSVFGRGAESFRLWSAIDDRLPVARDLCAED